MYSVYDIIRQLAVGPKLHNNYNYNLGSRPSLASSPDPYLLANNYLNLHKNKRRESLVRDVAIFTSMFSTDAQSSM